MSDVEWLQWLGFQAFPFNYKTEIPEVGAPAVLYERVADATGLVIERLIKSRTASQADLLRMQDRTGFCPKCWEERRRPDAAYLSQAWAREWGLHCTVHGVPLWDFHECARAFSWHTWGDCFADRGAWAGLSRLPFPELWGQLCGDLQVEPETEWHALLPWLRQIQTLFEIAAGGRAPANELLAATDLMNFLQADWSVASGASIYRPNWVVIDAPAPSSRCHARELVGTQAQRLAAALITRRLLLGFQQRSTGEGLLPDSLLRLLKLTGQHHAQWWLKRRMMQWQGDWRRRGFELFGLEEADRYADSPYESCRDCVHSASVNVPRLMNQTYLHPAWRCHRDVARPAEVECESSNEWASRLRAAELHLLARRL
jgi:hypothetical protein